MQSKVLSSIQASSTSLPATFARLSLAPVMLAMHQHAVEPYISVSRTLSRRAVIKDFFDIGRMRERIKRAHGGGGWWTVYVSGPAEVGCMQRQYLSCMRVRVCNALLQHQKLILSCVEAAYYTMVGLHECAPNESCKRQLGGAAFAERAALIK